ncbi:hypothetical protein, partial [Pantoea sp. GbtcB22]|uniref:hypothetical protein n=1 Tax=Pantoea sp. GbtcB22 TaxID=2824767 RepID=UPI001C303E65
MFLDEFVDLYQCPVPLESNLKGKAKTYQHILSLNVHILGDMADDTKHFVARSTKIQFKRAKHLLEPNAQGYQR